MKNPLKLIDKKILAILLGAIFLLTLVSVIAIVLIVSKENRDTMETLMDRQRREEQALTDSTSFGLEDFYLDTRNPDVGVVYPVRQPQSHWSLEEVDKYWINPSQAGITTLSEDNDKKIFQSLGVPYNAGNE
ncbi:MAG: hypothetical protein DRP60_04620 [Spirochaetes bacterium]|nr:MAG: hypothetical protein DRP60_04620 [Spirochaetota bacterium]